jgi:hypothetical protein
MKQILVAVILLGTATWSLGCISERVLVSPEYPVYWNVENAADCGLYIRSENPISFASSVVEVKRTAEELRVKLSLWNKTGKDILILRNFAGFMRWKIVTLHDGQLSQLGRPLYPVMGYAGPYDLLGSTAGEKEDFNKLDCEEVAVVIPLMWSNVAEYSDIELAIQLNYYVLGCDVPAVLVVKRTMRVVYVD